MKEFKARLYIKDASDPVAAVATVSGGNIVLDYGEKPLYLPVSEVVIKEGGELGDRVRVSHSSTKTVVLFSGHDFLDELESRHPDLDVVKASRAVKQKVKHAVLIRGSHVGIILGVVASIVLVFYLSFDLWVDMAADKVPVSVEETIGEVGLPKKLLKDEKKSSLVKRVNDIGAKLVATAGASPYKFHFYVEESKVVNAYSLPGGNIVVMSKLINEAKSDDELAGVLAHEIGHVVHRDSLRRILHTSGLGMCIAIVTGGTVTNKQLAVLIPTMKELERLNYSRVQEAAADKLAVELSLKAGYRPEALIEFFKRLQKDEEGIPAAALLLVSDHPLTADRIKAIEAEAAQQRKILKPQQQQKPHK